jgi:hypothetical protein
LPEILVRQEVLKELALLRERRIRRRPLAQPCSALAVRSRSFLRVERAAGRDHAVDTRKEVRRERPVSDGPIDPPIGRNPHPPGESPSRRHLDWRGGERRGS